MKVLIGSKNPVKIEATEEAFRNYYPDIEVIGISVDSKVPEQPVNEETFIGAKNRAQELENINAEQNLNAQFFIGIEGGIKEYHSRWFAFGGVCILDSSGKMSFGTSPHFELPPKVIKRLLNGVELGVIMDEISGDSNTKQKGGAVGYFTKGVLNRKDIYIQGIISALIPLLNKDLFFDE